MTHNATRRQFLRTSSALGALGSATPFALNLAALGAASAQTATDYKAIICVFLYGGNDSANTVIPYDPAAYQTYRTARPEIARARDTLVPLRASAGESPLAMPPELAALAQRYNDGQLAIVANVGPLVAPLGRSQWEARSVPVPSKLFSHNDQQSTWQASAPEGAQYGWGGRIGDIIAAGNMNQTFTAMSVSGNAVWLSGQNTTQYQVTPAGAVEIAAIGRGALFGSTQAPALLQQMITKTNSHAMARDYSAVTRRSIDAQKQLVTALGAAPALATSFPADNGLAAQLRMVARSIASRNALGVKRQVFFVSLGGFDHHAGLNSGHPSLIKQVADAMDAFYRATIELGVQDQVVTFTASDFGRALASNGDGSDHGWGAHHLVLGGAVKGGKVYGQFPTVAIGTDTDAGQGRLIPTTAVDQYAGTFASFVGLSAGQRADVLPNIGRFASSTLDFV